MHVGELIVARYELEELVGEGGMSSVYRAYDTVLERRVAIKVLHEHFGHDPEHVERFRREARAIARLAHPNVVTVIDRGEWEGRQFIVFEHVAGENLKAVIDREGPLPVERALDLACQIAPPGTIAPPTGAGPPREGPLPVERALDLACQIAQALSFAHRLGIVHRDVKPHNVLVDASGTAKVTDFGIARALDVDDALTATGTVLGTGQYLSPEQANGGRGDERSDQYSLGVVTFELLAGEPPYSGDSLMAVAMRHVHDPVPSVRARRPDVPVRVDEVVAKAMAKRPQDRFASMDALAAELETCLGEAGGARPRGRDDKTGIVAPPRPPAEEAGTFAVSSPEPAASTQVALPRRSGLRVAGVLLGAAVILVGGLLALEVAFEDGLPGFGGGELTPVRVQAIADFDPYGDNTEHPETVSRATDRDVSTYWTTEDYRTFDKPGVGIVLDAGSRVALSELTVVSDTPGYSALILGGVSRDSDFVDVAGEQQAGRRATFAVDTRGEDYRYYVVWITGLTGHAHVNEVRAFVAR